MSHDHPPQLFTPPKYLIHLDELERDEKTLTVYLVRDQHGQGHTTYFARPEDAAAYAERCSTPTKPNQVPANFIVIPVPVWGSLTARDAADDEGVG